MKKSIQKIKEEAIEAKIPIIMDDTLEAIANVLKNRNPKTLLEIGTAVGYSTICFSNILNNEITIDTVELDEAKAKLAKQNISRLKLEDNIKVLVGDAVEILPTINKKYDIVFIDASKSKYPFFLEQALRLTNKGSIIIADNILYKGYVLGDYNKHKQRTAVRSLREYLEQIETNPSLHTKVLDVGDGLAISVRC